MDRIRRTWLLVVLTAASLALVTTACDHKGEPMILEWDLSGQPPVERFGWTPPSNFGATVREPIERVHLTFDDRVFEASHDIHDVTLTNDGEWLVRLQVDHQPMTVEDAAELMRSVGMGVPDSQIDDWVKSTEGTNGQKTPKFTGDADQTGFGKAAAWIVTRYSFTDGRPVIVSVGFGWTRSLCEAGLSDFGRFQPEQGGGCV